MNSLKFILLAFATLLLVHCKKDDTPQEFLSGDEIKEKELEDANEEIYFSFVQPGFYNTKNAWIIVHDLEGNLIGHQSLSDKSFYELKATKGNVPERFNITILSADLSGNTQANHTLYSYTNIKKGSFWYENYHNSRGPSRSAEGKWDLRITNVPNIKRLNVFAPGGRINSINDSIEEETDGSNTLVLYQVSFITGGGEYLISIRSFNGDLKYIKVSPEMSFDNLEVDYGDFVEFDSYLEKELPPGSSHLFYTAAYTDENPNYYQFVGLSEAGFSLDWNSAVNNLAVAGYLDTYSKFRTEFSVNQGDYEYGLLLNGPKLATISIPEKPVVEIINNRPQDFKFNTNQSFNRKNSFWQYRSSNQSDDFYINTYWYISSGEEASHLIGEFPKEITDQLPLFNIDDLELKRLKLYTNSNSYEDHIDITTRSFVDQREELTEYLELRY